MTTSHQPVSDLWSAEQHEEEIRLMEAARADLTRFAPLYERYAPRIYAYCLRRLHNREESEDMTSQVFTQALWALDRYRGGSVAAWLFRIAHNAVVSHFRGNRPQVSFDALDSDFAEEQNDFIDAMMEDEERRDIQAFLRSLPDDQQELVSLRISAGLTAEEVGQVLGKSAGAVRVEYHRIISRMRLHYQDKQRDEL